MIGDNHERMRDAEFAVNIGEGWGGVVGGYYGGPRAARVWTSADWRRFSKKRKLPIWVAGLPGPSEGAREGEAAVRALRDLRVPKGSYTALDMETMVDRTYVESFGHELASAGYRVFVYGSASTVFGNHYLNGYWVADYRGIGPYMYNHAHVRATQYQSKAGFDSSSIKTWTYFFGHWWR